MESKLLELDGAIAGSEQLSVQETPPKLPSDSQKVTSAITEVNATQNLRHWRLQCCVGTRVRLGYAAYLMRNYGKRVLSLHCKLYVRVCTHMLYAGDHASSCPVLVI